MKNAKVIIALLVFLIIISIAAGYLAGFFVYKEYKEKTAYLEKQAEDRFGRVESTLKKLYVTLKNTMDENKIERKKALAVVGDIKEGIKEWKRRHMATISELKEAIDDLKVEKLTRMVENLQDDIIGFKMTMQDLDIKIDEVRDKKAKSEMNLNSVNLGRISVKK